MKKGAWGALFFYVRCSLITVNSVGESGGPVSRRAGTRGRMLGAASGL
jgi:hypothetical protein